MSAFIQRVFAAPLLSCSLTTTSALVMCASFANAAENWPQWRGPQSQGANLEGENYPVSFSADEGFTWKSELPGIGRSTPAVWEDRIFVTGEANGQDAIACYDYDSGDKLWQVPLGKGVAGKHINGSGSNPSPTTDGQRVVVYYKSGTLACLDFNGEVLWKKNMQEEFGTISLWWDLGNSPLIVGENVIVAVMQDGPSYLAAFDLGTGELAWKQDRTYQRPRESDQSYTTPQIANVDGREILVTFGADHLTGHDPATGKLLWDVDGFNPRNQGMQRTIASPAIAGDTAVVPYGRGSSTVAVQMPAEPGEKTLSEVRVWEARVGSDVPTPVISEGRTYVLGDSGQIACFDLESGKQVWTANLPRNRSKYYGSPTLASDLLYCVREDGAVFVGRVSDSGYEQLAENSLGERVLASPVPIRGDVLIRGDEHLYRMSAE